jgi:diguanylate cyclase (GGDEF)-like protein
MRWIYLIVPLPWLTEWLERGQLPTSPRELITEVFLSSLLFGLAWLVCRQHDRLASMAETDGLTGLLNAWRFHEDLRRSVERAHRQNTPLSLALLDMDGLKSINDRHGHPVGDSVLRQIGAISQESVRRHVDRCYRIGGDEFAIILPEANVESAKEGVERIRASFSALALYGAGVSAGVVELSPDEDASALIMRADILMYAAKSRGKNQVASQLPGPFRGSRTASLLVRS